MSLFAKKLKSTHTTSRAFRYEKNSVVLAFTLRTDVKTELETFEELLVAAIADVQEEIKN